MKSVSLFFPVALSALAFVSVACKHAQNPENSDSDTASLETVKMCEPGLLRWFCRPTSDIFFAVKIDGGYCFYGSTYKGKSPDEKPKYVADLYRDERYTVSFPTMAPKKVSRTYLLAAMAKDIEKNAADPKDYKGRFLEVLKGELDNADKTPGKVNLNARYATKVGEGYQTALLVWMADSMRSAPQMPGGSCPAPRALVGAK